MPLTVLRARNGHEELVGPDGLPHDFMVYEVQVIEADMPDVGRLQSFFNLINGYLFAHDVFVFLRVRAVVRPRASWHPRTPDRSPERRRMESMSLDE